jgi:hypothetical protein
MTDNTIEGQATSKNSFSAQKYSFNLGDQMSSLVESAEKFSVLSKDPVMFSQIFVGLKTAIDNFNMLLIDLNKKLNEIDERIAELEISRPMHENQDLTKKDQEVLDYVMTQDKVMAEEVQEHFDYKGKHAASARLHKLFSIGKLQKTHAGRTVYYTAPKNNP